MPMLSGTAANQLKAMTSPTDAPPELVSPELVSPELVSTATMPVKATADPAISHFSCWRRSPDERR
jgi:hypothetical protein